MNMFPSGDAESETQSETQSQESQLASNQTTMPDIEGRTLEEATKLLQEKSLGRAVTEEISDEYEPGYVIRAEYEAGTVLEKNTQVNIYVSKTPSTVTVPDYLIGNTESTVTKALEELGLKVKVEKGASGKVEKGEVYDTSPKAGEDVQEGDTVTIYVKDSEPVQMTEVPNLENRTESEAENLLEEAGLVGKSSSDYSDTVEEGKIISQDQEAGTSVPENTQISYVISKGSRLVKVPSVLTYEQEAGKALLISAGLSVGEITEEYNEAVSGTIISQSIDAEVEVARGSTINLVVSKGPEPIVVPDIIGEQESDALKTLEDAGLEGLCMEYRYSEEPKGTVIEIEPQEGSEVTSGQIIYYVLSDGEEDADDGNE
jgi:serine/threonine-protein kinase